MFYLLRSFIWTKYKKIYWKLVLIQYELNEAESFFVFCEKTYQRCLHFKHTHTSVYSHTKNASLFGSALYSEYKNNAQTLLSFTFIYFFRKNDKNKNTKFFFIKREIIWKAILNTHTFKKIKQNTFLIHFQIPFFLSHIDQFTFII